MRISDWSSDVCSSDLSVESYGDISDGNPAEFLQYMPGVDTDGAGDSVTNVQLRGLPSSMTGVTLDGDSLPGANASGGAGRSRAVSFEGLSFAGLASYEISQTHRPTVHSHSPDGPIHIHTTRAVDRTRRNLG